MDRSTFRPARPLRAALLLGALGLLAGTRAPRVQNDGASARPVQVFVLRHAEKVGDDPRDPTLSAAGESRAAALAQLLGEARITRFFSTEYRRTQATLEPLARVAGAKVEVIPATDLEGLVAKLRALPPGTVAAVAGHSNTVPAVVEALGGEVSNVQRSQRGPLLHDDEFDRLFLVSFRFTGESRPEGQAIELRIPPEPWTD